jgi:hypothetical protein
MSEFTFNGKTYKIVKDTEITGYDAPCKHCVFEHDLRHQCSSENRMLYTNGDKGVVGSCSANAYHYRDIK